MNSVKLGDKSIYPSKVVCVGRNYLEHIKELNNAVPDEMVVFNKPSSSISSQLYRTTVKRYTTRAKFALS